MLSRVGSARSDRSSMPCCGARSRWRRGCAPRPASPGIRCRSPTPPSAWRAIFFIDIAVPRDVDPKVNEVDDVYLYDLDDLQGIVHAGQDERQKEMKVAEAIVERETEAFLSRMKSLEVTPTIVDLRRHLHE